MKMSRLFTVGFLFMPLCVQGEKLPADRQEEVITAYGMKKTYDDRGDCQRRVGPLVQGEGRVLGAEDLNIDGTNAALGGDCDIDCTTAEQGTGY